MVPIYPEVALHDPKLALYSGEDGLELIRKLSKVGLDLVKPGGVFAMEHADSQSEAISQLLLADGWQDVADVLDLNGKPRMVTAKR
jgi:release factor glutamine methyltransferase